MFAQELSDVYGPLFSFPIIFQVVPDYICAYEHTRLQYFDVIVQRETFNDSFTSEAFFTILAQIDGFVPPFIYLQDFGSAFVRSANPNIRHVSLTAENELPIEELYDAIVASLSYVEPRDEFRSIPICDKDEAYISGLAGFVGASPATDREDCSSRGSSAPTYTQLGLKGENIGEEEGGSCMAALLSAMEV